MDTKYKEVHGDSTLYAGMFSHVGDQEASGYVSDCIDDGGRVWRNPEAARAQKDYVNSSSRDMFLGAMLGGSVIDHIKMLGYVTGTGGLISPESSDGRNKLGILGFAQLIACIPTLKLKMHFAGWRIVWYFLLNWLRGPLALIEALTVYKHYQLNLVYATLMLNRQHGVGKLWEPYVLKVLETIRGKEDAVLYYLKDDLEKLEEEANRSRASRQNALNEHPTWNWYFWTPGCDITWLGRLYPEQIYVEWTRAAADYLSKVKSRL